MPGDDVDEKDRRPGPAADGRRTRWDAHRARRREQLVDAALAVAGDAGPDFGLDQVAARAGVTKPVIYRHFSDRAALVQAMAERATNQLMERLMPAVYADGTPLLPRIRMSVDALVRFLDESPNVYRILALSTSPDGTDAVRADKEFVALALTSVFGDHLRAFGSDDPDAAEMWAQGIVGFVQNTVEWWLERRSPSRDRVTELLTVLIWAQIDGMARRYGIVIDPDEPVGLEEIARRRPGRPARES